MRIKRAFATLGAGVACAAALAACGDDDGGSASGKTAAGAAQSAATDAAGIDESKPPVRLALISFTVPGADLLSSFEAGADAAIDQINAEGGFGGREVVLDTCNTQLQPAAGAICARRTLAKDPVLEFGCDSRAWTESGLQLYAKAKVPSFNCPNVPEDFSNPYSFSINPSSPGQRRGVARWLCTRPDVKKVALVGNDLPGEKQRFPVQVDPILHGCGKETTLFQYPVAGGDLTPYVQKVARWDPDFVHLSIIGPAAVNMFKLLAQHGIEADQVSVPDTMFAWSSVMQDAGDVFDGAYSQGQFLPWGLDDPQVKEYLAAMEGSSEDPRDPTVEWSYQLVQFFRAAAKEIGFDRFDSSTMAQFMRTENGFAIPLSRELVNPGPKDYPQQKQPFTIITQYKGDGVFERVPGGDDGWFNGY